MFRHKLSVSAAILGLVAFMAPGASAVDPLDPIVRIEEDWELIVEVPDHEVTAPQIITAISPLANLAGVYATFEVNHIASVDFAAGGLHLSTWCGDTHLAVIHAGNFAEMYTDNETVRWTQAMEVDSGNLIFEIAGGTSTTWGNFGGDGTLRLEMDTTLENLSAYSPAASIGKSEVSFAGNRVQELSMKKVRFIHASGQVDTDNAQRWVHLVVE